jgi:hypothetical protein
MYLSLMCRIPFVSKTFLSSGFDHRHYFPTIYLYTFSISASLSFSQKLPHHEILTLPIVLDINLTNRFKTPVMPQLRRYASNANTKQNAWPLKGPLMRQIFSHHLLCFIPVFHQSIKTPIQAHIKWVTTNFLPSSLCCPRF